jgi:hypothetical protein
MRRKQSRFITYLCIATYLNLIMAPFQMAWAGPGDLLERDISKPRVIASVPFEEPKAEPAPKSWWQRAYDLGTAGLDIATRGMKQAASYTLSALDQTHPELLQAGVLAAVGTYTQNLGIEEIVGDCLIVGASYLSATLINKFRLHWHESNLLSALKKTVKSKEMKMLVGLTVGILMLPQASALSATPLRNYHFTRGAPLPLSNFTRISNATNGMVNVSIWVEDDTGELKSTATTPTVKPYATKIAGTYFPVLHLNGPMDEVNIHLDSPIIYKPQPGYEDQKRIACNISNTESHVQLRAWVEGSEGILHEIEKCDLGHLEPGSYDDIQYGSECKMTYDYTNDVESLQFDGRATHGFFLQIYRGLSERNSTRFSWSEFTTMGGVFFHTDTSGERPSIQVRICSEDYKGEVCSNFTDLNFTYPPKPTPIPAPTLAPTPTTTPPPLSTASSSSRHKQTLFSPTPEDQAPLSSECESYCIGYVSVLGSASALAVLGYGGYKGVKCYRDRQDKMRAPMMTLESFLDQQVKLKETQPLNEDASVQPRPKRLIQFQPLTSSEKFEDVPLQPFEGSLDKEENDLEKVL